MHFHPLSSSTQDMFPTKYKIRNLLLRAGNFKINDLRVTLGEILGFIDKLNSLIFMETQNLLVD